MSKSWAVATPGWTPAPTKACYRPGSSSPHWNTARALKSPAPRRSPGANGGSTAHSWNAWRSRCAKAGTGNTCCACSPTRFTELPPPMPPMQVTALAIPEVVLIEPQVHGDARGFFYESFNQRAFEQATGCAGRFVQDNHSRSAQGVLRGLHYQIRQPQGKLVRVVHGAVLDVVVDLRKSSPSFGEWVAEELSADNHRQLWAPPGFAHGFVVLSDSAECLYKTTDYYALAHERCIAWDDPALAIDWRLRGNRTLLSPRDAQAPALAHAEVFTSTPSPCSALPQPMQGWTCAARSTPCSTATISSWAARCARSSRPTPATNGQTTASAWPTARTRWNWPCARWESARQRASSRWRMPAFMPARPCMPEGPGRCMSMSPKTRSPCAGTHWPRRWRWRRNRRP